MDTTHTPGPWQATQNFTEGAYGSSWTIRLDKQTIIASVSGAALHRGPEQSEANARLIAAAPDLLAALQNAVAVYVETATDEGIYRSDAEPLWVQEARTAIAKAEGR